jgi:hypothetical protein
MRASYIIHIKTFLQDEKEWRPPSKKKKRGRNPKPEEKQ